jgi:IclR family transcriptional regulator, KDG regulon repressor
MGRLPGSHHEGTLYDVNGSSERGSQAVHRVLRVLLCWTEDEPTLSLTDVAERTGLTLPTAHRMIKALQREGFLVNDPVSGRNSLGPTITDLARVVLQRADQDELVVVAMPHLERMRQETRETVGLHLPMGDSRICVAELVSREPIRSATGVGRMYKLPRGAAGKALVAWSSERQEMIRRDGAVSRGEEAAFERELARIRERGWATSEGETIPGASAIAVPIYGPNGDVRAAINVTGPSNRWTRDAMMAKVDAIVAEVRLISDQLGARRPTDTPAVVARPAPRSTTDSGPARKATRARVPASSASRAGKR